jgi:hypothetical protein
VAVGPPHGRWPLAVDGVIIAIRVAVNNSTIPSDFVTRIAGFKANARMIFLFMI